MKILILAVIYRAILDWRNGRGKQELLEFFNSREFEEICALADICAEFIRRVNGIPSRRRMEADVQVQGRYK